MSVYLAPTHSKTQVDVDATSRIASTWCTVWIATEPGRALVAVWTAEALLTNAVARKLWEAITKEIVSSDILQGDRKHHLPILLQLSSHQQHNFR